MIVNIAGAKRIAELVMHTNIIYTLFLVVEAGFQTVPTYYCVKISSTGLATAYRLH